MGGGYGFFDELARLGTAAKRPARTRCSRERGPPGHRSRPQSQRVDACGLASRGPGASAELPKMLQAVSIDPAELSLTHPAVLRDMAVVCSECDEKSRCRSDLTLRIAAAKYDEYCPNAQMIEALQ